MSINILFSIFFIRPGFYRITLYPNKYYTLDLQKSSAFTFRESYPFYSIEASKGYYQNLTSYTINSFTRFFSVSDSPLVLKSDLKQNLVQWIIPSSICKSNGIMHNYGLSYKYKLNFTDESPKCLFFSESSNKKYITFNTNSRQDMFTAEFYTDSSLNKKRPKISCQNATICSVMMTRPFFVRLSLYSKRNFQLNVQFTTLNYSIDKPSCSTEIINELDNILPENTTLWPDVLEPQCISFKQEFGKVRESLYEIFGVFITIFLFLFTFRFINCNFCFSTRTNTRLTDLLNDMHSRELDNPIEGIRAKMPRIDQSTDNIVIQVDDDTTTEP